MYSICTSHDTEIGIFPEDIPLRFQGNSDTVVSVFQGNQRKYFVAYALPPVDVRCTINHL